MSQILLYVIIMACGMFLTQKNIIPNAIKKKLGHLQTIALLILICAMGYKIGIDDTILSNFKNIGIESFIFAIFTGGGSILSTFIIFKIINKFTNKREEN